MVHTRSARAQDEERLEAKRSDTMQEDTNPIDQLYSLDLWHDFLLLENQIPFFVISKLYESIVGESSKTTTLLTEKIVEFVEDLLHCYPKAIPKHNRPKEFSNLLHLCHLYFRPSIAAAESYENQANPSLSNNLLQLGSNIFGKNKARSFPDGHQLTQQAIPLCRVTEYQQAGIDIKKRKYSSEDPHSLLDIVFCNGILEIPGLTIDPNTQSLFCNLLAFEQTCPQFGNHFTTYITFFSSLVKMPDDVSLLTKRGIIVHQLNSDAEVCDLFRMIMECAVSVSVSGFNGGNNLKPLCSKIETYYQNRKPVLREFLTSITSKVHGWTQESESSELLQYQVKMKTLGGCKGLVMLTIFLVVIGNVTPPAKADDSASNAEAAFVHAQIGGINRDQEEKVLIATPRTVFNPSHFPPLPPYIRG